jgi:hypothetical protein
MCGWAGTGSALASQLAATNRIAFIRIVSLDACSRRAGRAQAARRPAQTPVGPFRYVQ